MLAATNLPWIVIVISMVSNLVVDVTGEVAFEYGVKYLRAWYDGVPGLEQASCLRGDVPAEPGQAYALVAELDAAFFECAQAFYTAVGAAPF